MARKPFKSFIELGSQNGKSCNVHLSYCCLLNADICLALFRYIYAIARQCFVDSFTFTSAFYRNIFYCLFEFECGYLELIHLLVC